MPMTPSDFRVRFTSALSPELRGLNLKLDEFKVFPDDGNAAQLLTEQDRRFLREIGMPRSAAPFLSFRHHPETDYDYLPDGYYPIGSDGAGNAICVDSGSGNVILLDHDFKMQRIFLNSTLLKFAECLCLYTEHLTIEKMEKCFDAMRAADAELVAQGDWWQTEIRNF